MANKIKYITALVVSCFSVVCFSFDTVDAAYTSGNARVYTGRGSDPDKKAMNDQEVSLGGWRGCDVGGYSGALGALWISSDTNNYYNNEVKIPVGVDKVDVQIRGSAKNCQGSNARGGNIYAVRISSRSNALTGLSSNILDRGNLGTSPKKYTWTSKGGYIKAKIDLSNIGTSDKIDIKLFRCFNRSPNNNAPDDSCAAEGITVNLVREQLEPTSYVTRDVNNWGSAGRDIKAQPGDTVYFQHKVENKKQLNTKYRGLIQRHAGPDNSDSWSNNNDWSGEKTVGSLKTWTSDNESFKIPDNAIEGEYYCRRYYVGAVNSPIKDKSKVSRRACAVVEQVYDYNIQPRIDKPDDNSVMESNTSEKIDVKGTVTHTSGATKSAPNINWQMSKLLYAPGSDVPTSGGVSTTDACGFVEFSAKLNCEKIKDGTEADGYAKNSTKSYNADTTLENYPIGTKICFVISVNKYNTNNRANDNAWRHSAPSCIIIAKKPKVQFWGADVRTGSNVYTSKTTKKGSIYGSWAEFAIMANKSVNSASRAELASTPAGLNPAPSKTNHLTFANTDTDSGNFGVTITKPAVSGRFNPKNTIEQASYSASGLASGVYNIGSNLELTESANIGNRIVLKNPDATVRITGNITYSEGPHSSSASLPQLIIIAKDIIVEEGVSRVDAWLISDNGYVSTCGAVNGTNWSEGLKESVCNNRLTVNGPIISDKLYLRRTFGESGDQPGSNPGTPAEIINLRPDAYLYGSSESQASGSIRTMNIKELPPRF